MWKKIFIVTFIVFVFGYQFLYQRSYLIVPVFFIQQYEQIPPVNCSEFGFGNKSLNNIPIYDFFILNNELDMLEIHLYELYDYVSLFLIAESNVTLSGKPKPYYLKDNWIQFSRYHKKIRRVEVPLSNLINTRKTTWDNEKQMRDKGIRLALQNFTEDFLLLTSDVDEIPKFRFIRALKLCQLPQPFRPLLLQCDFYYYSFEFLQPSNSRWPGGTVSRFNSNIAVPSGIRLSRLDYRPIRSSCFHCSYCLDSVASVRLKLNSFSHAEYNKDKFRTRKHILDRYKNGKDLFDRTGTPFKRSKMNETELPRLLQTAGGRERFMYMLNRSSMPNIGFHDI